ncbi:unnamed protein product [Phytophthora fragariaefolia]|uniref:Unnamed protein product n=1 Tax=Phytophthora fragariaefolia TaxID=1490495 RepID=A0A9W6TZU8_9STRA|nr:unnamed protein product [Phytophthora fragariaefolia]
MRDIQRGYEGAQFAASESAFLIITLFVQYFEWFPLEVSVYSHFKRILEDEKQQLCAKERRCVERSDMVALSPRALMHCLTKAHIVDGFEETGIYPLCKSKMLESIIGDCPLQNEKENVVKLTAKTIIIPHTARWLERKGLDQDTIHVLSLNHWELDDLKKRKKLKTNDEKDQYVHGGCLMTADKIIELVEKKVEKKRVQLAEKKRRRKRATIALAKQKELNERKLMRLKDHQKLRRLAQNDAGKRCVPEPEPSFLALK